jgi:hypothetical protein
MRREVLHGVGATAEVYGGSGGGAGERGSAEVPLHPVEDSAARRSQLTALFTCARARVCKESRNSTFNVSYRLPCKISKCIYFNAVSYERNLTALNFNMNNLLNNFETPPQKVKPRYKITLEIKRYTLYNFHFSCPQWTHISQIYSKVAFSQKLPYSRIHNTPFWLLKIGYKRCTILQTGILGVLHVLT